MSKPTEEEITLAAVRMLTDYRSNDGRRFHPDDTLSMIRAVIDNRHPKLDHSQSAKAKHCAYCDDRGLEETPDWDNGGFSLCVCARAEDVDMSETPERHNAGEVKEES